MDRHFVLFIMLFLIINSTYFIVRVLFLKYLEHSLDTYHCGQLFNVYSCTCIIFLVDCTFVLYFCVIFGQMACFII